MRKPRTCTQASSDDVLRLVRLARLPHFVWTIEADDTTECVSGRCVDATALYDSTSYDLSPTGNIMSVPGVVTAYPQDNGTPVVIPGGPAPWQSL